MRKWDLWQEGQVFDYSPNAQTEPYMNYSANDGLLPAFSGAGLGAVTGKPLEKVEEKIFGLPESVVYGIGGFLLGTALVWFMLRVKSN